MTDTSSESSSDKEGKDENDVKGIAEEGALRQLLDSDEEEEGEGQSRIDEDDPESSLSPKIKLEPEPGSDLSSDSGDDDLDGDSSMQSNDAFGGKAGETVVKHEVKIEPEAGTSKSQQQVAKRKPAPEIDTLVRQPTVRRQSIEPVTAANSRERFLENVIRKYLSRKPMTVTNLLKSIKSKIKIDKEDIQTIADIIKRICDKRKINEQVYLHLKT